MTSAGFYEGRTAQEYLDHIELNRETIRDIFEAVNVPTEDRAFFDCLSEPLRWAVFTEEWCPDGITTTPSLLRLTVVSEGLEARVFQRDRVLEVANSLLPAHRQGTLPVFVVFDSQMRESGRFIETAKEILPSLGSMEEEVARANAAPEDLGKPLSGMSETSRTAVRRARLAGRVVHGDE